MTTTADSDVARVEAGLPGAEPFPAATAAQIAHAWEKRQDGYRPRTRHLISAGRPRYTNRLFLTRSPYLQQHAHNPVNWFRWGEEAFAEAKRLNRPVLLSVGYSTCHWCHVMEEESFEDLEIARYLNEHYIAIKVDREERPDVDAVYMRAVQMLTSSGGWPMTVWLTPDRLPFYGGSYYPPRDGERGSRTGFLTLLRKFHAAFQTQKKDIVHAAKRLAEAIRSSERLGQIASGLPGENEARNLFHYYESRFDPVHGGLEQSPKFPSSLSVRFLLRYYRRSKNRRALDMATLTLKKMAAGGIYDHVGGGFHRYSTDIRWLVPHFEKMLYDNGLLASAYLEAYQVSGDEDFSRVAREILRYVERDMMSADGGFYAATDADSLNERGERDEGIFYTWTPEELREILGRKEAQRLAAYYGVSRGGNFEGRTILSVSRTYQVVAKELGLSVDTLRESVSAGKEKLYQARKRRSLPIRDEKILSAWNGLMISAFAQAATILQDNRYAKIGARGADFILRRLRHKGRLLRAFSAGKGHLNGYLDDYAFMIAGLIDLYETSGKVHWLEEAISLDNILRDHFEDRESGGYYLVSDDHEKLVARQRPSYDGARPSGNSVQALNLLRLGTFSGKRSYRERAERLLRTFGPRIKQSPAALSELMIAVDFLSDRVQEIVIVAPNERREAKPFLDILSRTYVPNRIIVVAVAGSDLKVQSKTIPLLKEKAALRDQTTAYVCENKVCKWPTRDPQHFAKILTKDRRDRDRR